MKNNIFKNSTSHTMNTLFQNSVNTRKSVKVKAATLPQVMAISTFPPKECGIATYTKDLVRSLKHKFGKSFEIKICALDTDNAADKYNGVDYVLNINDSDSFSELTKKINENEHLHIVLIQHEFGLFRNKETEFLEFLKKINKSILVAFHTVLPKPNELLQQLIQQVSNNTDGIIVMTHSSKNILFDDYQVSKDKIAIIPHGTHLIEHTDKEKLKEKYNLTGKKVLATFGLLSSGKGIETTLEALPYVIKQHPEVLFLIIGRTHPTVLREEGEKYRIQLEEKIEALQLQNNIQFVNEYLPLEVLLEYLQLTDIYLFTSKDPNQAVSGTFSYAMSCGCPIISTPIPHAVELLKDGTGVIIDFENSQQLGLEIQNLLENEPLRKNISLNGLHKIVPTAWENSAIAHAKLLKSVAKGAITLQYNIPEINLNHLKKMTTSFGIIQFSVLNHPDINSGYTLDDNARALIAMCQHYEVYGDKEDLDYIKRYLKFIKYCLRPDGWLLNYVDKNKSFTSQNYQTNLEDSNGRAVWALGYMISISDLLPDPLRIEAENTLHIVLQNTPKMHSTRAMAFSIKGLYYSGLYSDSKSNNALIKLLADRLVQMYRHEYDENWHWYERYLTYANSIIPEALLCAYLTTGNFVYKEIAESSFHFLLSKIFYKNKIRVISNKGWLHNGEEIDPQKLGGEQPIDVAYTILALSKFYDVFQEQHYSEKAISAFDWFLGNNHLNQIVYNPCTGGCYDGVEDHYVNLNQGAESTVSYLMARLTIGKIVETKQFDKKATLLLLNQNSIVN